MDHIQHGWEVCVSLSGEVIDVKTRRILLTLKDEFNNSVASEKMVEVQFKGGKAVRAGNQFRIGGRG